MPRGVLTPISPDEHFLLDEEVFDGNMLPDVSLPRAGTDTTGVYFIRGAGLIKIGIAWDVRQRFATLRSSSPVALEPIGFIRCQSWPECHALERHLHERFAAQRQHGEWFLETPAILEHALEVSQAWPTR